MIFVQTSNVSMVRHAAAHVDIACPKRHTVLHLLAVHGVEERDGEVGRLECKDVQSMVEGRGHHGTSWDITTYSDNVILDYA